MIDKTKFSPQSNRTDQFLFCLLVNIWGAVKERLHAGESFRFFYNFPHPGCKASPETGATYFSDVWQENVCRAVAAPASGLGKCLGADQTSDICQPTLIPMLVPSQLSQNTKKKSIEIAEEHLKPSASPIRFKS